MPPSRPGSPSTSVTRLKWTALIVCVVLAVVGALLGLRSPMLHQYEYQEDLYVALDGTVSVYVSASVPALVALYGANLPTDPHAFLDRAVLRRLFSGDGVTVGAIRTWRRWGRRFVTVRVDADNVSRLPTALPFSHNSFVFGRGTSTCGLIERVGASVNRPVREVGWNGRELVGFRWHIPSAIVRKNIVRPENLLRGNILVWEQPLTERLAGTPLSMEVEMQSQTILSNALWLFAISVFSALVVVALIVWWVVRKGKPTKPVRT